MFIQYENERACHYAYDGVRDPQAYLETAFRESLKPIILPVFILSRLSRVEKQIGDHIMMTSFTNIIVTQRVSERLSKKQR